MAETKPLEAIEITRTGLVIAGVERKVGEVVPVSLIGEGHAKILIDIKRAKRASGERVAPQEA